MTKELEALERILNYWVIFDEEKDDCKQIKDILPKSSQIVKTALKRLENHEQNEDFNKDVLNYAFLNEQDKIKKLKALDIIVKKNVSTIGLKYHSTCENYNNDLLKGEYPLTQEEFDLLKEVLL